MPTARSLTQQGIINPSPPLDPTSETSDASHPSDLTDSYLASIASPVTTASSQQVQQPGKNNSPGIKSLSIIRSRALSSASPSTSPVRRKPLPSTASPLATRFSSSVYLEKTTQLPEQSLTRPYSIDSPTLYEFPLCGESPFSPTDFSTKQQGASRRPNEKVSLTQGLPKDPPSPKRLRIPEKTIHPKNRNPVIPSKTHPIAAVFSTKHAQLTSHSALGTASESFGPWYGDLSSPGRSLAATMSIFTTKPTPPQLTLPNAPTRTLSNESNDSNTSVNSVNLIPKSPGASKLGSFFNWGGNTSPSPSSSSTSFSEKAYSPISSPQSPQRKASHTDVSKTISPRNIPTAIDIPKANADAAGYFGNAYLQIPPQTSASPPVHVDEMEEELKAISSELASSIRREMDLEDLVERLQAEVSNPSSQAEKRTSDYFSDSGTSSVKYLESDPRQDELDRLQRKTEQEKAQMRLELTNKVQEERARRKELELQIRRLEDKASQQVDLVSVNSLDTNGRLRELEATCEDLRRRLAEERQVKDNFEDLLTALKGELQTSSNERDNLRDEIVPQLKARVDGLEAQAAQHEKLTYEYSKMQQELYTLKIENTTLNNTQRLQMEMQQRKKFDTIAEHANLPRQTRSNSLAQGSLANSRPPSLYRSGSVKTNESRETLAERLKDVELQRDALHQALKSLLERQEHQTRENSKKIRQLEMERDRVLSDSPKRLGYDKEVSNLREEINTLRRRADDAIEQKWQCEKGLSGLKMDLDRAEQEIASLRSLLQEKDILIPAGTLQSNGARRGSTVTSESLERAYRELQKEYADSLARINALEMSAPKDAETARAIKQLEQTLSNAISERDFAIKEAESFRQQSDSLRQSEKNHIGDETKLADDLRGSAKRVEELATQVRQQLASNSTLRQRLSETIERGEKEQRANAQKIMFMQERLKSLEDQLMAAQQASEESISRHEDEIRELKESHNVQLLRVKEGIRNTRIFSPKTPLTPMFANSAKAPRILSTTSGRAMSVSEESKMDFLKQRVMELETALQEADKEMEEVVGRMNIAQIEVMELQNEREEAVRETKRLQKQIEEEKVRAFEQNFAKLSS